MIIVQCKNGLVAFRVLGGNRVKGQLVYCMNSDKQFTLRYGPAKAWVQDVQALVAEAVRLQGAFVSVADIGELA